MLLTTSPGIEDITSTEIKEKLWNLDIQTNPFDLPGVVMLESRTPQDDINTLKNFRSIHYILSYQRFFDINPEINPLEKIKETIKQIDFWLTKDTKFRVTTKRYWKHNFTSMDIQMIAGETIDNLYPASVDLENPNTNIRVDVYHNKCFVGIQHNRNSLSIRFDKKYNERAALKANTAYAILRYISQNKLWWNLLDPFCWSWTILLEANYVYSNLNIIWTDIQKETLAKTYENLKNYNLEKKIKLARVDATKLTNFFEKNQIDYIVTNPPYGIRLGRNLQYFDFYQKFLEESREILKSNSEIVLIVLKKDTFENVLNNMEEKFTKIRRQKIEAGGLFPYIYHLKTIK